MLLWRAYRAGEQAEGSLHRHLTNEINIAEGDIVVNAGAQEGDFAPEYIDEVEKLYIFECDSEWVKALKMTYKEYMNKVVIVPKMLGNKVDEYTTTLQEAIPDRKVDFIKMDIERTEVEALDSAQKLLQNNNVKCAICSYHKQNGASKLEAIFNKIGIEHLFQTVI